MNNRIDTPPDQMSLQALAERSLLELHKFRRQELSDDRYSLELAHRALLEQDEAAWNIVYTQWQERVRSWFRGHVNCAIALRYDEEQTYIDDTFKRFWQSLNGQPLKFSSLANVLRYLHLCLNSVLIDTLRSYARKKIQALPEPDSSDEQLVEDNYHESEWWSIIESMLPDPRERRALYLLYHCGLKPKEIVLRCPGEFAHEYEIYRLRRNGLDRLKRNSNTLLHKLCWQLD